MHNDSRGHSTKEPRRKDASVGGLVSKPCQLQKRKDPFESSGSKKTNQGETEESASSSATYSFVPSSLTGVQSYPHPAGIFHSSTAIPDQSPSDSNSFMAPTEINWHQHQDQSAILNSIEHYDITNLIPETSFSTGSYDFSSWSQSAVCGGGESSGYCAPSDKHQPASRQAQQQYFDYGLQSTDWPDVASSTSMKPFDPNIRPEGPLEASLNSRKDDNDEPHGSGTLTDLSYRQWWKPIDHVGVQEIYNQGDSKYGRVIIPWHLEAPTYDNIQLEQEATTAGVQQSIPLTREIDIPQEGTSASSLGRTEQKRRSTDRKRLHGPISCSVFDRHSPTTNSPSINVADDDGDLPIHIAVAAVNENAVANIIRLMISACVSLDTRNKLQQTALHLAAVTGHPEIVSMLVQNGASCRLADRNGNTALHLAVRSAPIETLKIILKSTSSNEALNRCNYDGFAPLHLATFRQDVEIVSLLAKRGADCNCLDGTGGRTPLFHAVLLTKEDIIRRLISHGASVNLPNYAGVMPLVVATDCRSKSIASLLISNGATINFRDDLG